MDYQHFHYVFKECTQNNIEYLILSMIHLVMIKYDIKYDSSLHVGVDILNLLLLYELFMFFHV